MNITLTGFMGTGKSSVGKFLSERLGYGYFDSDEVVETEAGMSVKDIFSEFGEGHFRELEKSALVSVFETFSARDGKLVVSTGGGVVLEAENMTLLRENSKIICLKASVDSILSRMGSNDERPLLSAPDPKADIELLLEYRSDFYNDADLTIDTTDKNIETVSAEIISSLGLE